MQTEFLKQIGCRVTLHPRGLDFGSEAGTPCEAVADVPPTRFKNIGLYVLFSIFLNYYV